MPYYFFLWDEKNIRHVAEHGVTTEEFEEVVQAPQGVEASRSSGLPVAFGYTADGRFLACVYEKLDDDTIYPVTAYEPDED